MSKFTSIATQAQRDQCMARRNKDLQEIARKLEGMALAVEAEARNGHFATVYYEFSSGPSHWWYDRPKKPDHRWEGLLKLKSKAESLGLKTEIRIHNWHIQPIGDYKLIISWD